MHALHKGMSCCHRRPVHPCKLKISPAAHWERCPWHTVCPQAYAKPNTESTVPKPRRSQNKVRQQGKPQPRHSKGGLESQTDVASLSSTAPLTDEIVQSAVQACNSWQQLAALCTQLDSLQGQQTGSHALHSIHENSTNHKRLHPRHAVMLLTRLAQLHPSPVVKASVLYTPTDNRRTPSSSKSSEPTTHMHMSPSPPEPATVSASITTNSTDKSTINAEVLGGLQDTNDLTDNAQDGQPHDRSQYTDTALRIGQPDSNNTTHQVSSQLRKPQYPRSQSIAAFHNHINETTADDIEDKKYEQEQQDREGIHNLTHNLALAAASDNHLNQLSPMQICDLLSAVAKLGYNDASLPAHAAIHLASSGGLIQLRSFPDALANLAWSLAKLQHDPGPQWISQYLHITYGVLPKFNHVSVPACCWALARWGFRPAEPWCFALYDRLRVVGPKLGPQGIVNVAWALAMWGITPPRPIAELIMVEAQVSLQRMTPAGIATLFWSLATLQQRPPNFWLEATLATLARNLGKVPLSARGLPFANIVWSLAIWQTVQPSDKWFVSFCRHCAKSLPVMDTQTIAVVVTGLADLGYTPTRPWVSLALEEFHKRASDAKPTSLVNMLWGVSRLLRPVEALEGVEARDWKPPRKWLVRYAHILQDLSDRVAVAFPQLTANELLDVLVAVSNLRFHPGSRWLATHTAYSNLCVLEFTPYQLNLLNNAQKVLFEVTETDYMPLKGEVV